MVEKKKEHVQANNGLLIHKPLHRKTIGIIKLVDSLTILCSPKVNYIDKCMMNISNNFITCHDKFKKKHISVHCIILYSLLYREKKSITKKNMLTV